MGMFQILYWLDLPIIFVFLSAILSIKWSHAILPKFLFRSYLLMLWCVFFFLVISHIFSGLTLINDMSFGLALTVYKGLIVIICCTASISFMEIFFYFMNIKRPLPVFLRITSFSSITFIPLLVFLDLSKLFHSIIMGMLATESWFFILIIQIQGIREKNPKTSDPAVGLIKRTLTPLLILLPFQLLELMLLSPSDKLEGGNISRFSMLLYGLIASIFILKLTIPFHRNRIKGSFQKKVSENFIAVYGISPREKEIITILMAGKSHRRIGEELCISPRTVDTHVHNIYQKCEVSSWKELFTLLESYK